MKYEAMEPKHVELKAFNDVFEKLEDQTKGNQSHVNMPHIILEKLETHKNEFGRVNIYCCQNFEQRCEETLSKPSQIVVSVLYAFGTETTSGWN